MEKYLKKLLMGNILIYVVYIIFGIFLIDNTGLSLELISLSLGLIIILNSLLAVIKFISDGTKKRFFRLEIFYGILGILLGLLIIFDPFEIFNFFIIGFGIWLIIEGLMKFWYGVFFRKNREEIWPLTLGIGLVSIILGIILIINPFSGVMVFTKVLGVFIIGSALLDIMNSMLFYRRIKEIIKLIN